MEEEFDIRRESLKTDQDFERALRPVRFEDFAGQDKIIENLRVFVAAAKLRGESLDHVLFHGPPGLGKTTLSNIIANELGVGFKVTSGPVLDKPGDLAGLLTSLDENDVLFIDEIHRLSPIVEEYLYSAMEDFVIDIMLEQGAGARSVRLNLPKFSLIGATTRQGKLSSPLRSRFTMTCRLDYYSHDELVKILTRSSRVLGNMEAAHDGLYEIARRSRGTPRIANNLLRWVRDFAQVSHAGTIQEETASQALKMLNIDDDGLDEMDNRILETIIVKFNGRPVGLKSLAVAVGEDEGTIEDVYEPYLIQEGYIMRTPTGRVATSKAEDHYARKNPGFMRQGMLF